MPRNDGRTRVRDAFGKPGTRFVDNSLATPAVIEERSAKIETNPKKFLTAHDRIPSALLISTKSTKGDNTDDVITEDYQTIPSAPLTSLRIGQEADGAIVQDVKQRLAQVGNAPPSISLAILGYVDEALDANIMERSLISLYNATTFPVLTSDQWDPDTGGILPETSQIVAAGTSPVALTSGGQYTAIEAMDKYRSRARVRTVTTTNSGIGIAGPAAYPRTYKQFRHVALPRVCTQFFPVVFDDSNGNIISALFYAYLKDFSGNYDVTVVEDWRSTPFTGLSATPLIPQAFEWFTPFGGGNLPECLHDTFTITATCSTDVVPAGYGRYYGPISVSWTAPATSPITLSGNITLIDTQEPFRGGYRRRTESITI